MGQLQPIQDPRNLGQGKKVNLVTCKKCQTVMKQRQTKRSLLKACMDKKPMLEYHDQFYCPTCKQWYQYVPDNDEIKKQPTIQ